MDQKNMTEEQAMLKVNSQIPLNMKVKKADVTVENGGPLKDLSRLILHTTIPKIYQKLGFFYNIDNVNENSSSN
jgi:dephospho-CoA kinase